MAMLTRLRGIALGESAPHLFLSHSTHDNQLAARLSQDLNCCEVDVWFDEWELRVGADLHERISEAIAKSKYVAVLVSKNFDGSKWIRGEVNQALTREKNEDRVIVLPLLVDDTSPPPVLSSKKFLDLSGENYFASLARLVGTVQQLSIESISQAILRWEPKDMRGCLRVLRYAGLDPYCIVDGPTLEEIKALGGSGRNHRVQFDPHLILRHPKISPSLRDLMERLLLQD